MEYPLDPLGIGPADDGSSLSDAPTTSDGEQASDSEQALDSDGKRVVSYPLYMTYRCYVLIVYRPVARISVKARIPKALHGTSL
jgi:hypothetical protein